MNIQIQATGEIVSEQGFRALFPHTSMPQHLTEEIINSLGGNVIFEGPQAQPTRYQFSYLDGVETIDGKLYTKWAIKDMDQEAKDVLDNTQAQTVRQDRNNKLSASDWTQVADAPVDKEAWAVYRQALRDISSQESFPWDIIWPEQP